MSEAAANGLVALDVAHPIWERFFTVAPLVLVATREADGRFDIAPKHMVMPLGWENRFGFVCSPRHATYRNAVARGAFTVSWPRPELVIATSLAAAPRCEDASKPSLVAVPTFPARAVDGVLVEQCYAWLECALERTVDDLGPNSLVIGRVVAAAVAEDSLRTLDRDDADLLHAAPLLAYVSPGRWARIADTAAFPFPAGFTR